MRIVVWLFASALVGGCLAHERPALDDAGTDARVEVDARVPDAGHDAFVPDAPPQPDASFVPCEYVGWMGPSYSCPDDPDLQLQEATCSTSGARCEQLEVYGRASLDDSSGDAGTTGPRCYGDGERLLIHRCAPGSQQTMVRATLLEAPMGGAGVVMHVTGFCACEGTASRMGVGDTIELRTMLPAMGDPNEYAVDDFRFFGEGAHFAVEACAYTDCSRLPSDGAVCCSGTCAPSCP